MYLCSFKKYILLRSIYTQQWCDSTPWISRVVAHTRLARDRVGTNSDVAVIIPSLCGFLPTIFFIFRSLDLFFVTITCQFSQKWTMKNLSNLRGEEFIWISKLLNSKLNEFSDILKNSKNFVSSFIISLYRKKNLSSVGLFFHA